jgi:hypothetical protein
MLSNLYAEGDLILAQLEALKIFSNTRTVRLLRRELKDKLEKIEQKIEKLKREVELQPRDDEEETDEEEGDEEKALDANTARSAFMKREHHYVRLIYDIIHPDHPEITYADVRHLLSLRRKGKKVRIPDVIWQNPSP